MRKGILYLLDAFARFKHPRKRLRIVGGVDASMAPLLAKLPNERVEYLGNVPNAELASLYSAAHVFVLPSIEEGLAMVMAEAMACGCPVIATENSGAEDLFTNDREGFIVPIRSADSLLRAIESLADQPERAQAMRALAVSLTRDMGGWNEYGRRWRDLLGNVTSPEIIERPLPTEHLARGVVL